MQISDAFTYFLIVLGGFAVVWGYRLRSKLSKPNETEYLAFSALWGVPLFVFFLWIMSEEPELLAYVITDEFGPFAAAPTLFMLGLAVGLLGFEIVRLIKALWKALSKKLLPKMVRDFFKDWWTKE